jgi:hypothetical protein
MACGFKNSFYAGAGRPSVLPFFAKKTAKLRLGLFWYFLEA